MRFATFDAKDTIEEFVRRTYPNASDADRKRIEAALMKTNPQLRQPKADRATTMVVLPDVPGAETDVPGVDTVARGVVEAIRNATPQLRDTLRDRIEQQHDRLEARLGELKQRQVIRTRQPALQKQLAEIGDAIRRQQKELRARQKTHDEAIGALEADLDAFLRGKPGPSKEVEPPSKHGRRPRRTGKRAG